MNCTMNKLSERIDNIDIRLSEVEVMLQLANRITIELDIKSQLAEKKLEELGILLESIKTLQGLHRKELKSIIEGVY
ncbi:hypothetical protein [Vallitalea sp.]|uniref:hypothetical protein n=1 Tax=Vallitalea sp. TaxID=1882829 RepID=UPI0025E6B61C|nr:hypothetical protein [Vallitalea sp.]MCT4686607.1 hypothetical protein [Vallitalea sp.]